MDLSKKYKQIESTWTVGCPLVVMDGIYEDSSKVSKAFGMF